MAEEDGQAWGNWVWEVLWCHIASTTYARTYICEGCEPVGYQCWIYTSLLVPNFFREWSLILTRGGTCLLTPAQPDIPDTTAPPASTGVQGLDYETLTLMRLRQAERERLEKEIREQEAEE